MIIRQAKAEDAHAIADVFLRSRAMSMPYLPVLHTDEETRTWIRDHVLPFLEVHVADCNGSVLGFCAINGDCLDHLYVDPDAQRRGIGSALLEIAKQGRDRLHLFVLQRNESARDFYERRGFVLTDVNDGSRNEENEPDARYSWPAEK